MNHLYPLNTMIQMKPVPLKISIAVLACVSLAACSNLSSEVGNQLDALKNKTQSLDSLVNEEVNKVQSLDSLIQVEQSKVNQLDSLINSSVSRLDSVVRTKLK